ncbi:MAG TPA: hypothetical protein PKH77_23875 [Anaerolineae bacterium]|nr:hypothetical protein [Anaerolineae bacterium]
MEFLSQLQQDILRYLWQATQAAENPEAHQRGAYAGNPANGSGTMLPRVLACRGASAAWKRAGWSCVGARPPPAPGFGGRFLCGATL